MITNLVCCCGTKELSKYGFPVVARICHKAEKEDFRMKGIKDFLKCPSGEVFGSMRCLMNNQNDTGVQEPVDLASSGLVDTNIEIQNHLSKTLVVTSVKPIESRDNENSQVSVQNLPNNNVSKSDSSSMTSNPQEYKIDAEGDQKNAVPNNLKSSIKHGKKSLQNGADIEETNIVQSSEIPVKSIEAHNSIEASHIEPQSKTETWHEGSLSSNVDKSNIALSSGTPPTKPVLCLRLIINSGSTAEFNVNPDSTVREITSYIHANWPPQWESDQVSDPGILRLIYQGRFLHSSITMKALNLHEGHTVVMHLIPRETLPESNANEEKKKAKREREGHCCCVM